ncbi:MAG: pyruvate dehydrogenase (acetyl-transferring) E1 component subunit alpha [Rhodospirillaceae bacterium]|nr:pyruvate dehydrogenase (acetyl-transferring) E1 component subunit alpha [Rhodospirillaceae bacterium]MBL6940580.1 pyruvate dehydrogenase (acetyl-transferring) E1 component subunit alpha [Rhodospirillales bacterium]
MTKVCEFEIHYTRFLDSEGHIASPLPLFADDSNALKALYRWMVLTRSFDARAVALQRTGRLGTFASSLGQEAVSVGAAAAMNDDDVLVPSFREQGALIVRGVPYKQQFLYWGGDERGSVYENNCQDFPNSIPVGSHAPHAAGAAMAMKLRGEKRAVLCLFGDGATSKGDVYEAMNIAGIWKLPVVFVINNNQWAISISRDKQTAAETLAQKAIAVGIGGEQVDGNDVIAVRHVVGKALERARSGKGPHLVEALTYRLTDHTTADDASRYRDENTVAAHWKEDPVARLRTYLNENAGWGKNDEEHLLETAAAEIEEAAQAYLNEPPQPPQSMFDFLFATVPPELSRQRDEVIRRVAEGGDNG